MAEFYSKANEAYVDEQFEEALQYYSQAIEAEDDNPEFYLRRSQTQAKLENFEAAEKDARKSVELNPSNHKGHLRLGEALFKMDKYEEALKEFQEADTITPNDNNIKAWLKKCEPLVPKPTIEEPISEKESSSQIPEAPSEPTEKEIPMPPIEKQRYDWYQTETHVVINILIKKANKDDVDINYSERSVSATVKQPSGTDYSLELDLAYEVVPAKCITKVLGSKIELKMKKAEGIRWSKLQGDGEDTKKQENIVQKYPSSSHYTRNWDKVVKDFEKDNEPTGEAAVNHLFQKIYADGSDEVRRAMNKSYSESGGTVLSTNWSDIGKKKTEVKAPDGMEYRKWNP
ncbi:protein SGT1 homolog [Anneissia japonica]|uniref:protein SGT1 homolog n=1 Tax=Anneissia japonica TaxID=1529436 RepID=UPI0014257508|nr:protein SGT1 homolog [Anneissia japonica]